MERVSRQPVAKCCSQPASLWERGKEIQYQSPFLLAPDSNLHWPNPTRIHVVGNHSCCLCQPASGMEAGWRKDGSASESEGKATAHLGSSRSFALGRFQASSPLSPHNVSTPTSNFTSLSTRKPSKKNIVISNFANFSAARSKFLSYRINSVPLALSKAPMYALNLDPSFSHKLHFF